MNQVQKALAIAIAKRDDAKATLERFRQSVTVLAAAEQTATKAEAEAQAQLEAATMAKVRGEADTTANARTVYQNAMADVAVAETEHAAGKRVVAEAERELEQLTKSAHRAGVEVAKAIAAHAEPRLLGAARAYGEELARHESLIRYASAASANAGTIASPVAELNQNNPLKVKLDALLTVLPEWIPHCTELGLLDAKLGGANGG